MAKEVTVIADASPLIALALIDRLPLLQPLFGVVKMVPAVYQEVMTGTFEQTERAIANAVQQGWLELVTEDVSAFQTLPAAAMLHLMHLDPGEAASISFAMRAPSRHTLLMDELAGRSVCQTLGLHCMGTAAVIGLAKEAGLISSAKVELTRLHAAGFWLSAHLVRKVLVRVGE
jgi:predicted nucleic acid-binding protein